MRQGTKSSDLPSPQSEYQGKRKRPARQKKRQNSTFIHKTDMKEGEYKRKVNLDPYIQIAGPSPSSLERQHYGLSH